MCLTAFSWTTNRSMYPAIVVYTALVVCRQYVSKEDCLTEHAAVLGSDLCYDAHRKETELNIGGERWCVVKVPISAYDSFVYFSGPSTTVG
jgi:hypothetical protein